MRIMANSHYGSVYTPKRPKHETVSNSADLVLPTETNLNKNLTFLFKGLFSRIKKQGKILTRSCLFVNMDELILSVAPLMALVSVVLIIKRHITYSKILSRRLQLRNKLLNIQKASFDAFWATEIFGMPLKVLNKMSPRFRETWMKPRSGDFWTNIFPQLSDQDYVEMIRMSKSTFNMICSELEPEIKPDPQVIFRRPISVKKKVAVTLYKLASCSEYRVVGNVFGIHKSTVHKCVYDVVNAINKILLPKYILMPNQYEAEEIANFIQSKTGFPQVIGAIDGTHIPILPPKDGYRDFINRKGWPSVILQAVVDHLYRFRDININYPGSCHDAVVFRNSSLFQRADQVIPRGTKNINGRDIPYMLLGDPAYPLLDWLQKPFTGTLDPLEESYNCYLSSARIIVENAFGRLKARWRCLLKRVDIKYTFVPKVVTACCVLHNIVETNKDVFIHDWLTAVHEAEILIPQPLTDISRLVHGDAKNIRNHLKTYMAENFPLRQSLLRP